MSKYLIQRFTNKGYGRLWLSTPQLEGRPDFYAYPDDAPVPKNMIVHLGVQPVATSVSEPHKPALLMEFDKKTITEAPAAPQTAAESSVTSTFTATDDERIPDPDDTPDPTPVVPALSAEAKHEKLVAILKNEKTFPKDEDHYTPKGTPRIDALISALGCDVQTQEMVAAFAAVSVPAAPAKVELTPGQRMDAIMAAIPKLKKTDMTANKRNPIPNIDALKSLTGIDDLNGVEREQAFAAFKKANPDWKPLEV